MSVRHVYAKKKKLQHELMSTTYQPFFFFPRRRLRQFPIESLIKLILAALIIGSNITVFIVGFDRHLTVEVMKLQHASWYLLFGMQAFVELLVYFKVSFPANSDYFLFFSWVLMHTLGWTSHVLKKNSLEFNVNIFVVYLLVVKSCAMVWEMIDRRLYWPVFVRCLATLVQGTWFIQVVFVMRPIFHNPHFEWTDNMMDSMWLENFFLFHIVIGACILLGQYALVQFTYPLWMSSFDKYMNDNNQQESDSCSTIHQTAISSDDHNSDLETNKLLLTDRHESSL